MIERKWKNFISIKAKKVGDAKASASPPCRRGRAFQHKLG